MDQHKEHISSLFHYSRIHPDMKHLKNQKGKQKKELDQEIKKRSLKIPQ